MSKLDSQVAGCKPFLAGGGRITVLPDGARLILPPASSGRHSDAQIDDYAGLARRQYPHRPPRRLSLRARFSHNGKAGQNPLCGTAGFGFWNNPFGAQSKIPARPQAIWFFYASPPSNMALALDLPGHGWKAACIDAGRVSTLAWAPIAPLVMFMGRSRGLYRSIWPRVQRSLGVCESVMALDMTDWHAYEIEWKRDGSRWWVDGKPILETDRSPRGPLGFVAWIDNQYAVVTPQGQFGFGLLDVVDEQWLEIVDLRIDSVG